MTFTTQPKKQRGTKKYQSILLTILSTLVVSQVTHAQLKSSITGKPKVTFAFAQKLCKALNINNPSPSNLPVLQTSKVDVDNNGKYDKNDRLILTTEFQKLEKPSLGIDCNRIVAISQQLSSGNAICKTNYDSSEANFKDNRYKKYMVLTSGTKGSEGSYYGPGPSIFKAKGQGFVDFYQIKFEAVPENVHGFLIRTSVANWEIIKYERKNYNSFVVSQTFDQSIVAPSVTKSQDLEPYPTLYGKSNSKICAPATDPAIKKVAHCQLEKANGITFSNDINHPEQSTSSGYALDIACL